MRSDRQPHGATTPGLTEAAYELALASEFEPQNRDENVDYYIAKLDELVKKFSSLGGASSAPKQESLAL